MTEWYQDSGESENEHKGKTAEMTTQACNLFNGIRVKNTQKWLCAKTTQHGKGTVWRVCFLVCVYQPRRLPSIHHWYAFSVQFDCQTHQTWAAQGVWERQSQLWGCVTKPRDRLNECSYQETDTATCLLKAHLEVFSYNTAIERFSIKKTGFDNFGILNTDRQHKYSLSWSPTLTVSEKINSVPVKTVKAN